MPMGVPAMIGLLAFIAFAPKLSGVGLLIGVGAFCLVQLAIGAAICLGQPRRGKQADEAPPYGRKSP
jgi:hypothetical protein